ncbi:MAG: biotin--[acetyl-CoA-carboxylase] ligase [Candidatus Korobacteraceae bacterium]|jgi:BirA family biotin operon repressor/biotin-[acetyl-CoA-carboxylase] ligase
MALKTQPGDRAGAGESSARTDARLGRLLRRLEDHPMLVMSGTKLAEELGTSRSEVWRLVEQLREFGVEISGHPSTGYRLEKVPDLLLPEILNPLLEATIFADNVHHFFRVGSTNTLAMSAASQGEPEGAVFVAEEQTAGRGRGGHRWESDSSKGIYCSAVLRPHLAPADVLLISLAAGLAVWEAVHEVTGVEADLRWPNDVLCGDAKVCGILIEMHAEATRVQHIVAGMGLNVNQREFPPELLPIATSLRLESGRDWSRVELAAALLKSLDREYRAFVADLGVARRDVLRRFELHSSYVRGRAVQVDEDGGYHGTTVGLDARGFLQVQTEAGIKTVLSGGVRPK